MISGQVKAADALTVIKVAEPGAYAVWARTADYPQDRPGTRLFRVLLNDIPMVHEAGQHGKDGYYWEKVGTAQLEAGENVIQLRDSRGNFARVDAVFLTADNINPNTTETSPTKLFMPPFSPHKYRIPNSP